jgi:hypothetical protein
MGGMDNYGLVHGWVLPLGAVAMPGIELLCALMLLLAVRTRAAALIVAGMLALFIGAMGSAMHRHLDLDCSCFDLMGADSALLAHGPAVRDLILTALTLAFLILGVEPSTVPRPRIWRTLLMTALFAWISFVMLDGGSPEWRRPLTYTLGTALILWMVLDLGVHGLASLRWGAILRDVAILALPLWAMFHVLGDGAATLGWGTIFRDVAMVTPAFALALFGPAEGPGRA